MSLSRRLTTVALVIMPPLAGLALATAVGWVRFELSQGNILLVLAVFGGWIAALAGIVEIDTYLREKEAVGPRPGVLYQAPHPLTEFVGREAEIRQLRHTLKPGARTFATAVVGMGGLGKTELIKVVAYRVARRFRDGVLWADCGQQDAMTVADLWAAAYDVQLPGDDLPTKAAAWRGLVSAKEALLIFDNVQPGQEIEPLFPLPGRSAVLITTRHADHPALHGAERLLLDHFSHQEATVLVEQVLGRGTALKQATEAVYLFELVDYLPLAVNIALHLAQECDYALSYLNSALEKAGALKVLDSPENLRKSLQATFETAWENLPDDLQWTFRTLALFNAGPSFSTRALTSTLAVEEPEARSRLRHLAGRSLLVESGEERWSLHPLLCEFADTRPPIDEATRARMAHHFFIVAQTANRLLGTEQEAEGLAEFDTERLHFVTAHHFLSQSSSSDGLRLLCQLHAELKRYYDRSGRWEERKQMLEQAIEAFHVSDSGAQQDLGELEIQLADVYRRQLGNLDIALRLFRTGLDRMGSDKASQNFTLDELHRKLGDIYRVRGEFNNALVCYKEAEGELPKKNGTSVREKEWASARGKLLSSVADAYARSGIDLEEALRAGEESLELHKTVPDPYEIVQSHRILADVHLVRGEVDKAAHHVNEARRMFEEAGQDINPIMGWILRTQGDVFLLQRDPQSARDCYEKALEVFRERRVGTGAAVVLKKLGFWELDDGNVRLALEHLDEAIAEARTIIGAMYVLAETLLARIEAGLAAERLLVNHLSNRQQGDWAKVRTYIAVNNERKAEFVNLVKGKDGLASLWAHFNYASTRSEIVVGVANSVSVALRFNPLDTLAYANKHDFPLVQVYLNQWVSAPVRKDLSTSRGKPTRSPYTALATIWYMLRRRFAKCVRERLVEGAQCHGIRLMCHAPGLLNRDSISRFDISSDALAVLQDTQKKWVVYHFDEQESLDVALDLVAKIYREGLVPCIENYHQLEGPEKARENYRRYLELFRGIADRKLPACAVLDIPRIFHAKLELGKEESSELTMDVLQELARLNIPVLLHLIDSRTSEQKRADWCPLGKGIIPFGELLTRLFAATGRIEAVILEFEDKQNSLVSRSFLEECIRAGVFARYPVQPVRWLG